LEIMNLDRNGKIARRPDRPGEDGWWTGGPLRISKIRPSDFRLAFTCPEDLRGLLAKTFAFIRG
jgi:hypothetical protein